MKRKSRSIKPPLLDNTEFADLITRHVQKTNSSLQESIDSDSRHQHVIQNLKNRLIGYRREIESWDSHYDYELWKKTEAKFEEVWPKIKNSVYLAIEYELYSLVRDIFFGTRHLLQITGYIEDRIYLASWLARESTNREEFGTHYLAISSLMGSYISAGRHRSYEKASEYWQKLKPFIVAIGEPIENCAYRQDLITQMGKPLYSELIMDVYESGVRLAVRKRCFDHVKHYITCARNEIILLSQERYISNRLKERFDLCFTYHEGVTAYLQQNFDSARRKFEDVIKRAEFIGWKRAVKGAKSWIATLAMEEHKYDTCEKILISLLEEDIEATPHPDKRDGICHLIKVQLLSRRGKDAELAISQEKATTALERFAEPVHNNSSASRAELANRLETLWNTFSLRPLPAISCIM